MATTYGSSSSALDAARRLLGDTGADGGVFLLADEEIEAELGGASFNSAVATLADGLAVRFAQYPDETKTPGGHSLKWGERVKAWESLAKKLRSSKGRGSRSGARLGMITAPEENLLR